MRIGKIEWIGKSKITKMKGATKTYSAIRLSDETDILGKTAQIYKAEINGVNGFLLLISDEKIDIGEFSSNESLKQVQTKDISLNYFELENRISKLENKFSELYELMKGKGEQLDENRAEH